MFLVTGVSGAIGATAGVPEYQTSQEGGAENTMAEGVESGAGPYAGPNTSPTRSLTAYYAPSPVLLPEVSIAKAPVTQALNPYTDNGPTAQMATNTIVAAPSTPNGGCGCEKIPWYVIVGLVVAVIALLKD